jgi:hypothetical protein
MWGGAIKALMELIITTIPIPIILKLNIDKKQKIAIAILLGVGYLVTIAGGIRTYYTYTVYFKTRDQTWAQYPAFLANAVENDLAVVHRSSHPLERQLTLTDVRMRAHPTTPFAHCIQAPDDVRVQV